LVTATNHTPLVIMRSIIFLSVGFAFAAVTQSEACIADGTCTRDKDTHCSSGGECPIKDNAPGVSLLQTKFGMNAFKFGGEEASSASFHDMETSGKNVFHQLKMSGLKNPDAILAELDNAVMSGQAPAFEVISKIRMLIVDQMKPGLMTLRQFSEEESSDFSDEIQACNDKSKENERSIEDGLQASVTRARLQHVRCRDLEKLMYYDNLTDSDSYCVKLGEFLNGAVNDANSLALNGLLNIHNRDDSVNYIEKASETNMCGHSEARVLADGCAAKED